MNLISYPVTSTMLIMMIMMIMMIMIVLMVMMIPCVLEYQNWCLIVGIIITEFADRANGSNIP